MQSGRIILITGAAGGVGALLVDRFLANGDTVVAVDLDEARLAQLSVHKGALLRHTCDIAEEGDCQNVASFVRENCGRLDVLINCAGYFPSEPFGAISALAWRRVIGVNLTGPFLLTQALLPLMKGRGWGRIINYGSGSVFRGNPMQVPYVSAKAGLIGFTRCLAQALGPDGITVNMITPGLTLTDAVKDKFPPGFIEAKRNERALRRDQHPEDLVGGTFFLASPDADFMTGQIVNIDGGNNMN